MSIQRIENPPVTPSPNPNTVSYSREDLERIRDGMGKITPPKGLKETLESCKISISQLDKKV